MGRIAVLLIASLLATVLHAAEPASNAPTSAPIDDKERAELSARVHSAWELVRARRAREALSLHVEPVIARYAAAYANSPRKVYAASGPAESLLYLALAAAASEGMPKDSQPVATIVIESTWADAYMVKGYAHVELGEAAAAEDALRAAVELSPHNPQYLSELAFVTQQRGDSEKAMALFAAAAEAADLIEDEAARKSALGRACRGQGYALIEMNRLEDAERKYHACLEIDRDDEKSLQELQYIGQQRQKAAAKP